MLSICCDGAALARCDVVSKSPRWFLPAVVYEITARTLDGQFLLRPDDAAREVILGVIGRALSLYSDISVHGFVFLSNHCHFLVSSSTGDQLSMFAGYVKGNIARRIGILRGRPGRMWKGRSAMVPIADNEALLGRLKYLLSQGVKEGLVERPEHWPGANSLPWFLGKEMSGSWSDGRLRRAVLKRGTLDEPSAYTVQYPISLSPIPCWRGLSRQQIALETRKILDRIAEEGILGRLYSVMGIEAVLAVNPLGTPSEPLDARRAPLCHASSHPTRVAFAASYREFVATFRAASSAARSGHSVEDVEFPPGSFPPAGRFVRAPKNLWPPWASAQTESPRGGLNHFAALA